MNDTPILNNEIPDNTLKVLITDDDAMTTTPDNITLSQVQSPVTEDVSRNSIIYEVDDVNAPNPVAITIDTPGINTTDPPIIEGCQNAKENYKIKILDIETDLKNHAFPLETSRETERTKERGI